MQIIEELQSGFSTAANGTANVYARGTSTPVIYYNDFEGLSPVTAGTAIFLDSQGAAQVYVNQLITLIVLDSSGTVVSDSQPGDAAPLTEVRSLSFNGQDYKTAAEGPGNPTTLQAILDLVVASFGTTDWKVLVNGKKTTIKDAISSFTDLFFNVKSDIYGAKGDGTTDDTAAIAATITAAQAAGGVVFFPEGTYRVTASLDWPNKVHFFGMGPESSIISMDNVSTTDLFNATGSPVTPQNFLTMRDLQLTAMQAQSGNLIDLLSMNVLVENCYFGGTDAQGPMVDGGTGLCTFVDCTFAPGNNATVMWFTASVCLGSTFTRCTFTAPAGARSVAMIAAKGVFAIHNCTMDGSAITSGTYSMLDLATAAVTDAKVSACVFTGATLATDTAIETPALGNGAGVVAESGSSFENVTSPITMTQDFTGWPADDLSSFASRESMSKSQEGDGNFLLDADSYGNHYLNYDGSGSATTITADDAKPGARMTLTLSNNGSMTLTPTFNSTNFDGTDGTVTLSTGGTTRSWMFVYQFISISAGKWFCVRGGA